MFLDASAIIAILGEEEDADYLIAKLEQSKSPLSYSPLSAFEAVLGLARKKSAAKRSLEAPVPADHIDQAKLIVEGFLKEIGAQDVSVDMDVCRKAIDACQTYGKAIAHPAQLNFGDCFTYACAKSLKIPLLFKGNDFSLTDIEPA